MKKENRDRRQSVLSPGNPCRGHHSKKQKQPYLEREEIKKRDEVLAREKNGKIDALEGEWRST